MQRVSGVCENSTRVPRARKNIFENIVFKSLFPCKVPLALFTLASLAEVRDASDQKENPTHWWGCLFGAGEGTLTPGLVLGKDAL